MISRVRRIVCCFFFLAGVGLVQTGSSQKTGLLKPSGNKDPTVIQVSARLEEARGFLLGGNYKQAEQLYETVCREAAELREPIWAGRCLTGLGNCRYSLFRYREALNSFLEAREFARRAGDWANIGTLDGNISSLYLMMGDLDAAAHAAQLAPEEIRHGGSTQGLALSLIQLAAIRARQGRMEESAGAIGRAIDIASRDGDFATVAQAWDHWGEELLARGAYRDADQALTEAFRLRKMLGLTKLGSSYYNLARLRLAQRDPDSALHLVDAALDRARHPDSLVSRWAFHHTRGEALLAMGRDSDAFGEFRTALDLARDWRLEVLPADFTRVSSEVKLDRIYSSFIDSGNRLYFATGREELARETFRAAEENRAASLHALQALPADWRNALPARYWDALAQLHALEVRQMGEDNETLRDEMTRLRAAVLEMESKAGGNAEINSDALVQRTRQHLPADAVLLSFHLGEQGSFLWAVSRERFRVYRLPRKAELAADIARFSDAVRTGAGGAELLGRGLYEELFGQLDPALREQRHWVVALDQQLFRVPFAALVAGTNGGRPVYLAERHSLRVTTGAVRLAAEGSWSWRDTLSGRFLGVGDAIYNTADPRWRHDSVERASFAPWIATAATTAPAGPVLTRLAGAGREVESCARTWDPRPGDAILLEGADASPARLRAAFAARPSIVHIAAHFQQVTTPPHYSMIALSLAGTANPQWLGPLEITRSKMQTGLVVLSGCSSGHADALPGSGLMGLTRAWLAAGARGVVASHWPTLDDSGTLFVGFYKHLRENPEAGPAAALQKAQLDMLDAGGWRSDPQYWAAYFVAGDL
ncbi:MAG TPA: CHAT domain-containing protein [Bryobacteraceae bacterium]|nr:CHAT domain-containing protein [Bryobacteraceae bacterium]